MLSIYGDCCCTKQHSTAQAQQLNADSTRLQLRAVHVDKNGTHLTQINQSVKSINQSINTQAITTKTVANACDLLAKGNTQTHTYIHTLQQTRHHQPTNHCVLSLHPALLALPTTTAAADMCSSAVKTIATSLCAHTHTHTYTHRMQTLYTQGRLGVIPMCIQCVCVHLMLCLA